MSTDFALARGNRLNVARDLLRGGTLLFHRQRDRRGDLAHLHDRAGDGLDRRRSRRGDQRPELNHQAHHRR